MNGHNKKRNTDREADGILPALAALSEDFDCVIGADLERNTTTDFRSGGVLAECIDGWNDVTNYTAKMLLFANALVLPSERNALLDKVQPETVRSALAQHPVYYVDCRVLLYGKERLYQLKFAADESKPGHAVIGFHNIDGSAGKRRREALELAVMNGLVSDFECVAYVAFSENRVTSCRVSERFAKSIPGWRTVTDYAVRVRLLADTLIVPEDRERFLFQTSPEQVVKGVTESPVYYVVFRVACEGETRIFQAKYVADPDSENCVILGIHDVDLEKQQDMARRAQEDAAKNQYAFLKQMSGDILSPLRSVRSLLESAEDNLADPAQLQNSLEQARATAGQILELVENALHLTGERESEKERSVTNIREFSERCASAVEKRAVEKNIRLVSFFDDIAHPMVHFNELHLRQIVLNLLNNAVRFTPEGGQILFRVSELSAADGKATFKIDVRDSGAGMSRDILEHIWDVFALRADADAPGGSGAGVGLAVCKMLADRIGATIGVDSKEGKGSCFTVLLPAELEGDDHDAREGDESILNGMHILVADDNELNQSMLRERLEDAGAIVTIPGNGADALELFKESERGAFDLILMDSVMPELDGASATRAIRATPRADALTIPVIGMGTQFTALDDDAFADAGMNAWLEKPVQIPTLVNSLLQCIHSRSQKLEEELAAVNERATKDALTGAQTRSAYERMEEELDRVIAAGSCDAFAYLFCDVNYLKYTNDTFGHDRGDELLRSACRLICEAFPNSAVYRMGGDEFSVLIRGEDYAQRETLLQKMKRAETDAGISLACGMTVFDPEADACLMHVSKRADELMYENKRKIKSEIPLR